MRVRGRNRIRPRRVNPRMNRESRGIDVVVALDHLALFVDQHKVGGTNLREVHAERIHPEPVSVLRVARRDVAGHAFVISKASE